MLTGKTLFNTLLTELNEMGLPGNFYDKTNCHTCIFVCSTESIYNIKFLI